MGIATFQHEESCHQRHPLVPSQPMNRFGQISHKMSPPTNHTLLLLGALGSFKDWLKGSFLDTGGVFWSQQTSKKGECSCRMKYFTIVFQNLYFLTFQCYLQCWHILADNAFLHRDCDSTPTYLGVSGIEYSYVYFSVDMNLLTVDKFFCY